MPVQRQKATKKLPCIRTKKRGGGSEAGKARPTKRKRRASVKGGFYFVPGLENRVTNYQRIRWKVKQAPWCLLGGCCTRRKERKQEREGEREGEKETAITSCSTMSKDAIYFCLFNVFQAIIVARLALYGNLLWRRTRNKLRDHLPFVKLAIRARLLLNS